MICTKESSNKIINKSSDMSLDIEENIVTTEEAFINGIQLIAKDILRVGEDLNHASALIYNSLILNRVPTEFYDSPLKDIEQFMQDVDPEKGIKTDVVDKLNAINITGPDAILKAIKDVVVTPVFTTIDTNATFTEKINTSEKIFISPIETDSTIDNSTAVDVNTRISKNRDLRIEATKGISDKKALWRKFIGIHFKGNPVAASEFTLQMEDLFYDSLIEFTPSINKKTGKVKTLPGGFVIDVNETINKLKDKLIAKQLMSGPIDFGTDPVAKLLQTNPDVKQKVFNDLAISEFDFIVSTIIKTVAKNHKLTQEKANVVEGFFDEGDIHLNLGAIPTVTKNLLFTNTGGINYEVTENDTEMHYFEGSLSKFNNTSHPKKTFIFVDSVNKYFYIDYKGKPIDISPRSVYTINATNERNFSSIDHDINPLGQSTEFINEFISMLRIVDNGSILDAKGNEAVVESLGGRMTKGDFLTLAPFLQKMIGSDMKSFEKALFDLGKEKTRRGRVARSLYVHIFKNTPTNINGKKIYSLAYIAKNSADPTVRTENREIVNSLYTALTNKEFVRYAHNREGFYTITPKLSYNKTIQEVNEFLSGHIMYNQYTKKRITKAIENTLKGGLHITIDNKKYNVDKLLPGDIEKIAVFLDMKGVYDNAKKLSRAKHGNTRNINLEMVGLFTGIVRSAAANMKASDAAPGTYRLPLSNNGMNLKGTGYAYFLPSIALEKHLGILGEMAHVDITKNKTIANVNMPSLSLNNRESYIGQTIDTIAKTVRDVHGSDVDFNPLVHVSNAADDTTEKIVASATYRGKVLKTDIVNNGEVINLSELNISTRIENNLITGFLLGPKKSEVGQVMYLQPINYSDKGGIPLHEIHVTNDHFLKSGGRPKLIKAYVEYNRAKNVAMQKISMGLMKSSLGSSYSQIVQSIKESAITSVYEDSNVPNFYVGEVAGNNYTYDNGIFYDAKGDEIINVSAKIKEDFLMKNIIPYKVNEVSNIKEKAVLKAGSKAQKDFINLYGVTPTKALLKRMDSRAVSVLHENAANDPAVNYTVEQRVEALDKLMLKLRKDDFKTVNKIREINDLLAKIGVESDLLLFNSGEADFEADYVKIGKYAFMKPTLGIRAEIYSGTEAQTTKIVEELLDRNLQSIKNLSVDLSEDSPLGKAVSMQLNSDMSVTEFVAQAFLIEGIYGHALKTITMGDDTYFPARYQESSMAEYYAKQDAVPEIDRGLDKSQQMFEYQTKRAQSILTMGQRTSSKNTLVGYKRNKRQDNILNHMTPTRNNSLTEKGDYDFVVEALDDKTFEDLYHMELFTDVRGSDPVMLTSKGELIVNVNIGNKSRLLILNEKYYNKGSIPVSNENYESAIADAAANKAIVRFLNGKIPQSLIDKAKTIEEKPVVEVVRDANTGPFVTAGGLMSEFENMVNDSVITMPDYIPDILIEDPTSRMNVMQATNTNSDNSDGAQFIHPVMYRIFELARGGKYSAFHTGRNTALKLLTTTVEYDRYRQSLQKKAVFNPFSIKQMMTLGSRETFESFKLMGTAMDFTTKNMLLPVIENGVNTGRSKTVTINNMHELLEHLDIYSRDEGEVIEEVIDALSSYPDNMSRFVGMVTLPSLQKTGMKKLNKYGDVFGKGATKKPVIGYMANEFNFEVLSKDHDYNDISGDLKLTILSQLVTAIGFGGDTKVDSNRIQKGIEALGDLHRTETGIVFSKIAKENEGKEFKTVADRLEQGNFKTDNYTEKEMDAYVSVIRNGVFNILERSFNEDLDSVVIKEILQKMEYSTDTGAVRQKVLNTLRSSFFKDSMKLKIPGLIATVTPSHNTIKVFTNSHGMRVGRKSYILSEFSYRDKEGNPSKNIIKLQNTDDDFDPLFDSILPFDLVRYNGLVIMKSQLPSTFNDTDILEIVPTPDEYFDPSFAGDIDKFNATAEDTMIVYKGNSFPKWYIGEMLNRKGIKLASVLDELEVDQDEMWSLKWYGYNNKETGENIELTDIYKNYYRLITSGVATEADISSMKALLTLETKRKGADGEFLYETASPEVVLPALFAKKFNLQGKSITEVMGYDPELQDVAIREFFSTFAPNIKAYKDISLLRQKNGKLQRVDLNRVKIRLFKKMVSSSPSGFEAEAIALIDSLKDVKGTLLNVEIKKVEDQINDLIHNKKNNYVEDVSRSFEKSLAHVLTRIPGQGKPSAFTGAVIEFLDSQGNSVHLPTAHMVTTGGDFDIDTMSIAMTTIDKAGILLDPTDYIKENTLDSATLMADYKFEVKDETVKLARTIDLHNKGIDDATKLVTKKREVAEAKNANAKASLISLKKLAVGNETLLSEAVLAMKSFGFTTKKYRDANTKRAGIDKKVKTEAKRIEALENDILYNDISIENYDKDLSNLNRSIIPESRKEKLVTALGRNIYKKYEGFLNNAMFNGMFNGLSGVETSIERSEPMVVNSLKALSKEFDAVETNEGFEKQKFKNFKINGENPLSIMLYENLNAQGKGSIGIFAILLKLSGVVQTAKFGLDTEYDAETVYNGRAEKIDPFSFDFSIEYFDKTTGKNVKKTRNTFADIDTYDIKNKIDLDVDLQQKVVDIITDKDYLSSKENRDGVLDSLRELLSEQVLSVVNTQYPNADIDSLNVDVLNSIVKGQIESVFGIDIDKYLLDIARINELKKVKGDDSTAKIESNYISIFEHHPEAITKAFTNIYSKGLSSDIQSQLLTAATDNAKELILGKIRSGSTTNSVISSMLLLGYDIRTVVEFLYDPDVESVLLSFEQRSRDLQSTRLSESAIMEELDKNYIKKSPSIVSLFEILNVAKDVGIFRTIRNLGENFKIDAHIFDSMLEKVDANILYDAIQLDEAELAINLANGEPTKKRKDGLKYLFDKLELIDRSVHVGKDPFGESVEISRSVVKNPFNAAAMIFLHPNSREIFKIVFENETFLIPALSPASGAVSNWLTEFERDPTIYKDVNEFVNKHQVLSFLQETKKTGSIIENGKIVNVDLSNLEGRRRFIVGMQKYLNHMKYVKRIKSPAFDNLGFVSTFKSETPIYGLPALANKNINPTTAAAIDNSIDSLKDSLGENAELERDIHSNLALYAMIVSGGTSKKKGSMLDSFPDIMLEWAKFLNSKGANYYSKVLDKNDALTKELVTGNIRNKDIIIEFKSRSNEDTDVAETAQLAQDTAEAQNQAEDVQPSYDEYNISDADFEEMQGLNRTNFEKENRDKRRKTATEAEKALPILSGTLYTSNTVPNATFYGSIIPNVDVPFRLFDIGQDELLPISNSMSGLTMPYIKDSIRKQFEKAGKQVGFSIKFKRKPARIINYTRTVIKQGDNGKNFEVDMYLVLTSGKLVEVAAPLLMKANEGLVLFGNNIGNDINTTAHIRDDTYRMYEGYEHDTKKDIVDVGAMQVTKEAGDLFGGDIISSDVLKNEATVFGYIAKDIVEPPLDYSGENKHLSKYRYSSVSKANDDSTDILIPAFKNSATNKTANANMLNHSILSTLQYIESLPYSGIAERNFYVMDANNKDFSGGYETMKAVIESMPKGFISVTSKRKMGKGFNDMRKVVIKKLKPFRTVVDKNGSVNFIEDVTETKKGKTVTETRVYNKSGMTIFKNKSLEFRLTALVQGKTNAGAYSRFNSGEKQYLALYKVNGELFNMYETNSDGTTFKKVEDTETFKKIRKTKKIIKNKTCN